MSEEPKMMYAFEDFLTPGMYYYPSEDRDYVERMMRDCRGGITDDFQFGMDRLQVVEIHPNMLKFLDQYQFAQPIPEDYTNASKWAYERFLRDGKPAKIQWSEK